MFKKNKSKDTRREKSRPSSEADISGTSTNTATVNGDQSLPSTLGELKASGWKSKTVKEELRQNLIEAIKNGDDIFSGIWGYEDSVFPDLENAVLAKHDIIFLGERGQAKTRLIRKLCELLDEKIPIVAGSEINDDPYNPVSKFAKEQIAKHGDQTSIAWVTRDERYGEKLATPDTSIADLIGEVDPIKVAEGRYLSDELTLHYGLVPRVNRGIFAINELPDLSERIQVGLLNVLEERDVQIRGYKIRLPLDILLVASANPEDYTNRGRIITPLKDRFGSQIRTHYPKEIEIEREIVKQEANIAAGDGIDSDFTASVDFDILVPDFMTDILVWLSHELRKSGSVEQSSGISVRLSVANYEALTASSIRRILYAGEKKAVPRICDLSAILPSMSGKVEFDAMESQAGEELFDFHIKSAILKTFNTKINLDELRFLENAFDGSNQVEAGKGVRLDSYMEAVSKIPELKNVLIILGFDEQQFQDDALVASGVEFILEGMHLNHCLNKDEVDGKTIYENPEAPQQMEA